MSRDELAAPDRIKDLESDLTATYRRLRDLEAKVDWVQTCAAESQARTDAEIARIHEAMAQAVSLVRGELIAEIRILHDKVRQLDDAMRARDEKRHLDEQRRRQRRLDPPNDDFYSPMED